jgi:dipeptidyl aminopeptidase/acylaminoacyl peptidase
MRPGTLSQYDPTATHPEFGNRHSETSFARVIREGRPTKLVERGSLSNVRWTPDGKAISYLSDETGSTQLWMIEPGSGRRSQLFNHAAGERTFRDLRFDPRGAASAVLEYEWSHDGQCVAFTSRKLENAEKLPSLERNGLLYDQYDVSWGTLALGQFGKRFSVELSTYCLNTHTEAELWHSDTAGSPNIGPITWSPDDARIGFSIYNQNGGQLPVGAGIVTVADRSFRPITALKDLVVWTLAWSPDAREMAYTGNRELSTNATIGTVDLLSQSRRELVQKAIPSSTWPTIGWPAREYGLLFSAMGLGLHWDKAGLYTVDVATGEAHRVGSSDEKLSDCGGVIQGKVVRTTSKVISSRTPIVF